MDSETKKFFILKDTPRPRIRFDIIGHKDRLSVKPYHYYRRG